MKRVPVNLESVSSAANSIKGIGIEPSARLILQKLGHGSMSTIQKYFLIWLDKQSPPIDEVKVGELDESISQSISANIANRVQEATSKLRNDFQEKATENRLIIEKLVELEGKLSESIKTIDALKERNAELVGSLEVTVKQIDSINQQLVYERNVNEQLKVEIAVSQTKLETFEIYKNESTRLSVELANVQRELQIANQKNSTAEIMLQKQKDFAKFGEE